MIKQNTGMGFRGPSYGMNQVLMSAKGIRKIFPIAQRDRSEKGLFKGRFSKKEAPKPGLEVLKGIDLEIYVGDSICIMGSSGSGKSTLLHILGALDRPSFGTVLFKNKNLSTMNDDELSDFRSKSIGFVFQFHHLLGEFSALENVMMPSLLAGETFHDSKRMAAQLLGDLGLTQRLEHRPNELSGGEQQRVAIARSLIRKPSIIFADEPTGNLDQTNGQQVQSLLFDIQKKYNVALVSVTHDPEFARRFPKVLHLRDGQWY